MGKIPQKYLKALTNVGFAVVVAAVCIWLLPKVLWLFMPFIIGWLISLLANPLVHNSFVLYTSISENMPYQLFPA